jgi:regulator of protease activity HflC (stomatin/prohibitin superfamily)
VETAKAKRDAAEMEAEAEVTRANGVAKANKIIGDSLKENESYLRYLWIMSIDHESAKTIIYIPTEANLPILEAGRLGEHKEPQPKEQK